MVSLVCWTLAWLDADSSLGCTQSRDRGVQILFGGGVLLHQRLQAVIILLRLDEIRLCLCQVSLGL